MLKKLKNTSSAQLCMMMLNWFLPSFFFARQEKSSTPRPGREIPRSPSSSRGWRIQTRRSPSTRLGRSESTHFSFRKRSKSTRCSARSRYTMAATQLHSCTARRRAGHFRYFLIFSILKNDFFCIFYQVNNLFLHHRYLKSPLTVKSTW